MDDDDSDSRYRSFWRILVTAGWIAGVLALTAVFSAADSAAAQDGAAAVPEVHPWLVIFPPQHIAIVVALLAFSAFFSASEVAFFSLHKLELRSLRESKRTLDRLAGRLMETPGNLLTAILMGNSIANVLLSVVMAAPTERLLEEILPQSMAYPVAVALCTFVLVFVGEITPKLLVVRNSTGFVRTAAPALFVFYRVLSPLRAAMVRFTGLLFRITRFSEMKPAPFMTDEEFKSLLTEGEATGAIEKDEREMIQAILEFSDVMLKEILVPRPDIIALSVEAKISEALQSFREHEYARMPVYRDDMDHIVGTLFAKDLLRALDRGDMEGHIQPLLRKVHFVPETMTVAEFLKHAQHHRTHMAIVVDEFGGTEGLVTLQDAIREVVGDIGDEDDDDDDPLVSEIRTGVYEVDGGISIDELEKLLGITVDDDEHTTIAGFLMEQSDKVLEVGDEVSHDNVRFRVEAVDGRRVSRLRIQIKRAVPKEVNS